MMNRITEYLNAHRAEIVAHLASLCAIPSVEGAPEEGKPFGIEVARALSLAEEMFREEGFLTERDPEGRYVLASFGEGERTVGIFAHADVVPAGEGWRVTEPFAPAERDGFLVARGAEDNKGGIVAALYLLKALRDLAIPLDSRILVFIGGNEETGMRDVPAFLAAHGAPAVSLVPDNDPPLSLGEKGRAEGWLVSPPLLSDVLDFVGGSAYNVVLDRATVTLLYSEALYASLSSLAEGDERVELSADPETERITLTAHGRAAHASHPDGSLNAAAVAAGLLSSSSALSADERGVLAAASIFLSDPFGDTLGIAGEDGPFGRRTAVSGMVRMRDGRLFLSQDIRYGSMTSWEELSPDLYDTVEGEEWDFLLGSAKDGFDLGDGDPLAEALLATYRRVTGIADAAPYRSGGGTYARLLPRAFSIGLTVPGLSPSPETVFGEGHGSVHAPDEAIGIDGYLAALRVLAEYVVTVDGFLKNE